MRPTPPSDCGNRLAGVLAELLAIDVIAGQLAQPELRGIVANAFETKLAAQFFKVEVVALGQRVRHVHAESGQLHRRVARHQPFAQRRQRHRKLDRRARLRARRERQLLVHHGQDAPARGINHHGGPVHVAQRVDRSLPDYWILSGRDVTLKNVALRERTGSEALVVTMMAMDKNGGMQ